MNDSAIALLDNLRRDLRDTSVAPETRCKIARVAISEAIAILRREEKQGELSQLTSDSTH